MDYLYIGSLVIYCDSSKHTKKMFLSNLEKQTFKEKKFRVLSVVRLARIRYKHKL